MTDPQPSNPTAGEQLLYEALAYLGPASQTVDEILGQCEENLLVALRELIVRDELQFVRLAAGGFGLIYGKLP